MNDHATAFVVFGLDTDQKPHAARFPESDAEVAAKAAALIGFNTGWAKTPEALAIATELPEGKVFATGKALVPYVKPEVYEKLVSLADSSNGKASHAAGPPGASKTASSDLWSEIKVGSLVIARSPFKDDNGGWWEAVVLSISRDGDQLTVRWTEFPDEPKFAVRRRAVAMRAPTAGGKLPSKPTADPKPASPKG